MSGSGGSRHKYRLKFIKSGPVRFIGHLDLLSLFNMAVKRADLPIAYSEGFNPHQLIAFALPLSLGYYSNGEYVDIVFTRRIDCGDLVRSLNATLPDGLSISVAAALPADSKNGAALVRYSDYRVLLPKGLELESKIVDNFIAQGSIVTSKKTKRTVGNVDIKEDIIRFESVQSDDKVTEISMRLSAGPYRSLRADTVMGALFSYAAETYPEHGLTYIREDILGEDGEALINHVQ